LQPTSPTFSSGWSYNRLTLRDGADLTVTTDFQDVSATSARQGEHVVAGATIKTVARRNG
jgi:hypothetical protein